MSRALLRIAVLGLATLGALAGCGPRLARPVPAPGIPKRIVAISTEGDLCALGIHPIAGRPGWGHRFRSHVEPCLRDAVMLDWSGERTVEAIARLAPDLVIARTDDEDLDLIASIAKVVPVAVVGFQDEHVDFEAIQRRVAKLVGRSEQAEAIIARYEAHLARTRACVAAHPGESATVFSAVGHELRVGAGDEYLRGTLGVATPAALSRSFLREQPASLERLAYLDATRLFVIHDFPVPGTEEGLAELARTRVWRGMPAVRAGHVTPIHNDVWWDNLSVLSQESVLDDVDRAFDCPAETR